MAAPLLLTSVADWPNLQQRMRAVVNGHHRLSWHGMPTVSLWFIAVHAMRAQSVAAGSCPSIEPVRPLTRLIGPATVSIMLSAWLLAACSSQSPARFSPWGSKTFPAKEETFEVAVFDSVLPERAFERIARIQVAMEVPAVAEGSLQDALPELKRQARLAGADAIVDIRLVRSANGGSTRFQVNATGIRFSQN